MILHSGKRDRIYINTKAQMKKLALLLKHNWFRKTPYGHPVSGWKRRIGKWLSYVNRARQYIGILNSCLLLVILLKQFDVILQWYWYPVIIFTTIIIFLSVGFLDVRLGIRRAETITGEQNSPIRMEMHKMLKQIHKSLYEDNNVSGD